LRQSLRQPSILLSNIRNMVELHELTSFLDHFFAVDQFPDELHGIYHPSTRPIARIGLALEPWTEMGQWKLQAGQLAPHISVIAYHLAFDERLTLGFNPRLAEVLGLTELEVLGKKEGRSIGMLGQAVTQSFEQYGDRLQAIFGGQDIALPQGAGVSRVAVVGAMNDALVREAAARGADLYITGQWRQAAQSAVDETKIGVMAIGHYRTEAWGLRALAGVLRERWAGLTVFLPPS
jgi:putative NIF3 family GTP cyclohydrolase 1 type 2